MSSTPLASTGAGPASVAGPARSASSCQDWRADPITHSSSSQFSHASLSGKADNVAIILGHAARLSRLDPASFPTVYNVSAATFPDTQLAIAPLLAQLIAMVNDLGASVTYLTSQVENVTSGQAGHSATPSPPATSNLEASLKDLSSRVAILSSHCTILLALRPRQVPPTAASAIQLKPAQQKKKLATRLSSSTVTPPDFPFLLEGKWYSNRDTIAIRHPDSPQVASSLPLATRSQRKPFSTPSGTQPPLSFTQVPLPGSQSLIIRSPKNKSGLMLSGRAEWARKTRL